MEVKNGGTRTKAGMPSDRALATQRRMIETGERLFAEHGVPGVSLRAIAEQSGHNNNNGVQYHFGNKDGLIRAILECRSGPINDARAAMLAEVPADLPIEEAVHAVVRCMVLPVSHCLTERGVSYYLRFTAQLHQTPWDNLLTSTAESGRTRYSGSESTALAAIDRIEKILVDVDPTSRDLRLRFAGMLILNALAAREEAEQHHRSSSVELTRFLDELISSVAAIFLRGR